jgi:hypothetical protein
MSDSLSPEIQAYINAHWTPEFEKMWDAGMRPVLFKMGQESGIHNLSKGFHVISRLDGKCMVCNQVDCVKRVA